MKKSISEIVENSIKSAINDILDEGKAVRIYHINWNHVDFYDGKRVLECTEKSIIIASDDCSIRLSARKRYEKPEEMEPSNGYYRKYWKYIGWEVSAFRYNHGKWEKYDERFPFMLKNKESVMRYIQGLNAFELAKKEMKLS